MLIPLPNSDYAQHLLDFVVDIIDSKTSPSDGFCELDVRSSSIMDNRHEDLDMKSMKDME